MKLKAFVIILLMVCFFTDTTAWRRRRRRRRPLPPNCSPRNCQVGGWTSWSACSRQCGTSGVQFRTRGLLQGASCGGSCPYFLREMQACNRGNCRNGGTPHSTGCSCGAGFNGTCCEQGESILEKEILAL